MRLLSQSIHSARINKAVKMQKRPLPLKAVRASLGLGSGRLASPRRPRRRPRRRRCSPPRRRPRRRRGPLRNHRRVRTSRR
jgi:hypothetical protein